MKQSKSVLRLGLIGPVGPYRGGIAQYNTQLDRALKQPHTTISFKRMYPAFLYPGSSVFEDNTNSKKLGVAYLLDTYSPLSWRRAADRLVADGCQVVLITWWTLFWQPAFVYITRRLQKHGVKVVFLCHNVGDHDYGRMLSWVTRRLITQADAYIVHSEAEEQRLQAIVGNNAPILQRPIPIYTEFPKAKRSLPKRGRLELLFFGFIRPYKGVEQLVTAVENLGDTEVYLTIVGEVWGKQSDLTDTIHSQNIELHLQYVDNQQVAEYFDRADVVVLPYKSATGSAVATLAYHYGKPILATNVGGLSDVVINGETGWLVKPNSPKALADAIARITRAKALAMRPTIQTYCKANNWPVLAKKISAFCSSIVDEQ